jgi:hypothetical protein
LKELAGIAKAVAKGLPRLPYIFQVPTQGVEEFESGELAI